MKRRTFCTALGAIFVAWPLFAAGQPQKKLFRVGFLSASPSIDQAFIEGLYDLGYREGQNTVIEPRSARGDLTRLATLAIELVALKPDLIVTQGSPAAQAAKKATSTIPIVMATSGDAVGAGLVASLARPGGNVTGLSFLGTDLGTKRLELLKETAVKASRIAFLANPAIIPEAITFKNLQSADAALDVTTELVEVRSPEEFESAFAAVARGRFDAALLSANSSLIPYAQKIVLLAARHRLPVMYSWRDFPEAGGLMSYGVNVSDLFRRAATYVDKILKGAKPSDLPVDSRRSSSLSSI